MFDEFAIGYPFQLSTSRSLPCDSKLWATVGYLLQTATLFLVFAAASAIPLDNRNLMWALQALCCLVGFYVTAAAYRHYFRSIDQMRKILSRFTLTETQCHCCSLNHASATGEEMMCDREVVYRCISEWFKDFGKLEGLEALVRNEALDCLLKQLSAQFFTYGQCLQSLVPVLWFFMDYGASRMVRRNLTGYPVEGPPWIGWVGLKEWVRGLGWWLGVAPLGLFVSFRMAYLLRRTSRWMFLNALKNLVPALTIVVTVLAAQILEQLCLSICCYYEIVGFSIEPRLKQTNRPKGTWKDDWIGPNL